MSDTGLDEHTMESWTKEEYKAAIASGALQETALDKKYYYAGGSVLYFKQPIEALIRFYKYMLPMKLANVVKLLGDGCVVDESNDMVNSLTAIYKNHGREDLEKVVVSKYVLLLFISNVADVSVVRARSMLRANPYGKGG